MTIFQQFIRDMAEGFRALREPRDAWYYYSRKLITARECLLLERYPENGGNE